jgi:Family of unknown function (DUF5681)
MQFQPGQSGNPAGRPPGARNKKTLAVEAAYDAKAEQAVSDIMERAKTGDWAAMRLCMDRAVPIGRRRRFAFSLPRIRTPEDAEAAIDAVMDGLAEGVLSLEDVAELLRIVQRLLELADVIRERKRLREFLSTRPPQQALREAVAEIVAANGRNAALLRDDGDDHDGDDEETDAQADDESLYFPVNEQGNGGTDAVDPPGPPHVEDSPPAPERGPPTPETVAA